MKKLNLICASIALAFGAAAATAGTLSTAVVGGTVFATENFGGSTSAATDSVTPGAVTYSMSTITAVNAGATVYFTVRLVGGKFVGAGPALTSFSFAGQAGGSDIASVTLSTDKSTALVRVVSAASVNLGLGAFSYTPAAAEIDSVNSTLAAAGGVVTVSVGLTTVAPTAYEATDALATVDGPVPAATMVTAAKAVNGVISASATTTKIDLTASPAGSAFTAARATLGKIVFTNVANTQNIRAGAADYTLLAGSGGAVNTGVSVVVTPGASQAFPIGSTLVLNSAENCLVGTDLATTGTGTVAFTGVTALTAKTIATTVPVVTAAPVYVCMLPPSATNTASPLTATLAATVAPASTKDLIATASGTGYALDYNGSVVEVTSYWPGALDAYSYKGYLKITNTGTVTAQVKGQHRNMSGALVGTATPLITLAAGESTLMSSVAIDALLGANPSHLTQGRIRITAPTDGLRVQSLLQTGANAPIEYSTTNGI